MTPPSRLSAETLLQMMLDTRADITRIEGRMNDLATTVGSTGLCVERISSKLDRALTMEATVVEMRSDIDRAKGMGIVATILLASLEGVVGIYSFFRR